jgi:threonine/homoserine/homoserine lactone efflux protein
MSEFAALASIVAALAVGTASPGPSFILVAQLAASRSRKQGLYAALGMGAGGALFAVAALAGLQALFMAVPSLFMGLKIAGGLYLCYLGWRIFRAARAPLLVASDAASSTRSRESFSLGLVTQLSNPKTAIVYASVFAALLPAAYSIVFSAVLVAAVFALEAGWYALVAVVLSSQRSRAAYLGYKRWVDRAAGCVMIGLGARLVVSAHRNSIA